MLILVVVDIRRREKRKETRKGRSDLSQNGLSSSNSGSYLLSHTVARAVPSAQEGLTSVFGMGTGGSPPIQPPENLITE
jgi:hypothetical protein